MREKQIVIWIFENWTKTEQELYSACSIDGQENIIIVMNDDGFLPAGVVSPYRFYIQKNAGQQRQRGPLFANLLEVPDLWEIRMYYDRAEIWDEGMKKAEISYAEPSAEHNMKTLRWMLPDGAIYKIDHYDQYGELYYTDMLDNNGHTDVRTYYENKKPVLLYQPDFDMYTVFREGKVSGIYDSKQKFLKQIFGEFFSHNEGIVSNNVKLLELLAEFGGPPCNPENDVLILTNSDQIGHIERLITELPMLHFHIAAKTLMSEKLLRLEQYTNVTLYPGISEQKRVELLIKSAYYLDINYYQEICNAVYEASRYNLLIAGFENTLHNAKYILPECVFGAENADSMIRFLESMYKDETAFRRMVVRQGGLLRESGEVAYENI